MKLTIEHYPEAPMTQDMWDSQIGKTIPMYTGNGSFEAELVIADVVAEGLTVLLTFDLPDDCGMQVGNYFSMGFNA